MFTLLSYIASQPQFLLFSLLSVLPYTSPLSQMNSSSVSNKIKIKIKPPRDIHQTWPNKIKRYNKNGHKPSYLDWTKQPSRKKRVLSTGNESDIPPAVLGSLIRTASSKLHNNYEYAEDLAQTCAGSLCATTVSVSPYEPCFIDSVSHICEVLILSGSYNPLSTIVIIPLICCCCCCC